MTTTSTTKPPKAPLPGYRFIFSGSGILLILGGLWMLYDLLFGTYPATPVPPGIFNYFGLFVFCWIAVGIAYLSFALRLRKPNLTHKHWLLGFGLMALGIITGVGIIFIFIFMALIWTDSDVRCHFPKLKKI